MKMLVTEIVEEREKDNSRSGNWLRERSVESSAFLEMEFIRLYTGWVAERS